MKYSPILDIQKDYKLRSKKAYLKSFGEYVSLWEVTVGKGLMGIQRQEWLVKCLLVRGDMGGPLAEGTEQHKHEYGGGNAY